MNILNQERLLHKKNYSILHEVAKKNAKEFYELLISKDMDLNAKTIHYQNLKILSFI